MNAKTGGVTLWDAKYRGDTVTMRQSPTFKEDSSAREKAVEQAIRTLEKDTILSPAIRNEALRNLGKDQLKTATVGFGGVKNSMIGK